MHFTAFIFFSFFFFFALLANNNNSNKSSSNKERKMKKIAKDQAFTKNEEHTPQFHIWHNLIHLFIYFVIFFPSFLSFAVSLRCQSYAVFFVQSSSVRFIIASIYGQRTILLDIHYPTIYSNMFLLDLYHKRTYYEAQ